MPAGSELLDVSLGTYLPGRNTGPISPYQKPQSQSSSPITFRALNEPDMHALIRTVDRSSPGSRRARFHEPLSSLPLGWARRICRAATDRVAVAAVVRSHQHHLWKVSGAAMGDPADDEIVALAQVEPGVGAGELAILVEDSYQREGLGRLVVTAALTAAAVRGTTQVHAHLLPDNDGIQRLLEALELPLVRRQRDTKLIWTMDCSVLAEQVR